MSTPIVELIAVAIETAINAITTGNGFNQDLVAVRGNRIDLGDVGDDLSCIVIQDPNPRLAPDTLQDNEHAITWIQPFAVQAIVIDSDDSEAAIGTRLNTVRSDIEKKIFTDPTISGTCWNTAPLDPEYIIEGPANSGVIVNFEVMYRVKLNDPFTKA